MDDQLTLYCVTYFWFIDIKYCPSPLKACYSIAGDCQHFGQISLRIQRYPSLLYGVLDTLRAISVQPEIPVSITGNFQRQMEHHFPQFLEKRTTSGTIPKFSKISYWEIMIRSIFTPEFQEFSVKWFAFGKFNNFRIFRKVPRKFSNQLPLFRKFGTFWLCFDPDHYSDNGQRSDPDSLILRPAC